MKILIYIIIALTALSIVNGSGDDLIADLGVPYDLRPSSCSTSKLCENYQLVCNYVSDNICPEDYGDWSSCAVNNYGDHCDICDPDCSNCGQDLSISFPRNILYPGGQITIETKAYGYPNGHFALYNYEGNVRHVIDNSANVECQNSICTHNFIVNVQGEPCSLYKYGFYFWVGNDYIESIEDAGMISPYLTIDSPEENSVLNGNNEIDTTIECDGGEIEAVVYYLYDGEIEDMLKLIHRPEGFYDYSYFDYDWDTTETANGDYRLDALVLARRAGIPLSYYVDSIDLSVENEAGIGGTYQGSKVLNIILARIKTWL
jgi:hypothetical protein